MRVKTIIITTVRIWVSIERSYIRTGVHTYHPLRVKVTVTVRVTVRVTV